LGIRTARDSDLEAILDIYNRAVVNSTATFDMAPRSLDAQREWFTAHVAPHSVVVCEEGGEVLGWGATSAFSPRLGYRFTGEVSVYVREDARRRGLGEALLRELIVLGAAEGLHTLVGRICEENDVSCRLAEKTGFRRVGVMEEVGYKFDRWLNVAVYELRLGVIGA
jgi:L-amino acid N-acyltransferase YncA